MKIWPWLLVAAAVLITRMDKPKDETKPGAAPAPRSKRVARGIRNNNPGNIRKGINWLGRVEPGKDASFIEFKTMPYGIRALYIDLVNKHKSGLKTVRDIIYRYAPPSENLTDAYVASVAKEIGIPANAIFEPKASTFKKFAAAVARHENGKDASLITTADWSAGWLMAQQRPDISSYIKNS
jgi:hypothetical protein